MKREALFEECTCRPIRDALANLNNRLVCMRTDLSGSCELVYRDVKVTLKELRVECTRCNDTGKILTNEAMELVEWMEKEREAKRLFYPRGKQ